MRQRDLGGDDNAIIGGDFLKLPFRFHHGQKGGILIPRQHVINSIGNIQNEFSLHNVWRVRNPDILVASRGAKRLLSFFWRLDYWLISDSLYDLVTQVDILASINTEHSSILIELPDIQEACRGPGFWKLNSSLLSRPDYVDKNFLFGWRKLKIFLVLDLNGTG